MLGLVVRMQVSWAENPITIPEPIAPAGVDAATTTILGWLRWGIFAVGVIGLLAGMITLAASSSSNNPASASAGKKGIVISGLVLLGAGLVPELVGAIQT